MAASPAAMMTTRNALACQRSATGRFATFFLASVHEPTLAVRFTNAGRDFPVLLRVNGERVLIEKGGLVIGMMEGLPYEAADDHARRGRPCASVHRRRHRGRTHRGEMFGEERLYTLLDGLPRELTAEKTVAHVLAGVHAFLIDAEAGDDITLMAVRVLPEAPAGA